MTYVYDLDHRHDLSLPQLKAVVGGKAANLAVMTSDLHLPVPPGFVVGTAACSSFLASGWSTGLDEELARHMRAVEEVVGRRFGDPTDPLLVSVRSGAPISMPGMMDTILNLGLNEDTKAGLERTTGDPAFAANCLNRFQTMYRNIVKVDEIPDDPWVQLREAIKAVFRSWQGERAIAYRQVEGIPDDLGTAVTVQSMVFGNRGGDSATGVLFTRDPSTGERRLFGDVMFDAQGEDVVSGTHQTQPLAALENVLPEVAEQLWRYSNVLERHYADLCDIEFTVEQGRLWLLQVRVGKRSPRAALRIALEMAEDDEFPLSRDQAVRRVASLLANPPTTWEGRPGDPQALARGLPASPGLATGEIVTTAQAADSAAEAGRAFILVRGETSPEDVPLMAKASGVLTTRGGLASHAAVVARGWGIPAVVGADEVEVGADGIRVAGVSFGVGETLTVDGSTGEIFVGHIPGHPVIAPEVARLLAWAEALQIAIPLTETDTGHAGTERPLARPVAADEVVACLSLRSVSTAEALADSLLASASDMKKMLDELVEAGLVRLAAAGARLTDAGSARGDALIRMESAEWGAENAVAALDSFLDLDHRVKDAVTAWQMREVDGEVTFNDHTDAVYDGRVLDALQDLHSATMEWVQPFTRQVSRLATYAARLERALDATLGGDERFVSSPRVDSYHSIWFELHEDLIRLAGRTREEEASAGRA